MRILGLLDFLEIVRSPILKNKKNTEHSVSGRGSISVFRREFGDNYKIGSA
jgi:hypothetical protein